MTKKKIVFISISASLLVLLLASALFGQNNQKTNVYRYLSTFSEVLDLVRGHYVEQVSSEQLMDGAFAGVTDAIDEFSYYVPPGQMGQYKNFVDIEDNGVGLVVTKRYGYAYVIATVPDSPAAKAGIEARDFIELINGTPTQKMAVWQLRSALRSDKPIKVQVLRGGQSRRDTFTLDQGSFHPVPLNTQYIGSVAYIQIPYFEKGSALAFRAALEEVRKKGTRKLIVDVRGNAAGDVEEAIAAADELLTSGLITSQEGRRIEGKRWQADRSTSFDGDVQVLADVSTAAGGEIFAAAIRGNSRGKVVGVTTYGKAIVQRFIPLPSGGGVQMTVAHYTMPDLKPIKENGVKPDVVVDLSSQAFREQDKKTDKVKDDPILTKALSLFGETAAVGLKKAA